jgi:pimeloyl-ACP methyl ester carboxylesterase
MNEMAPGMAAGLSYLARGGGGDTPIVLLHGIGSNAQSFEPLIRVLSARHRVVAWDAPGYGRSQPLAVTWPDASDYAAALDRLLVGLDVARCVLLGHSLGTLIAARFAMLWPERVAALVLASPALGHGTDKGDALPPAVAGRIEELDRLGAEGFAAARAPRLVADPVARPDVLRAVELAMAAVRRPGYDQAARLLAGGRLLDDAAAIHIPTAVLVGTQDRITPPANARRVYDALGGAAPRRAYREIADAGHAVCQEQPAEVARLIVETAENEANAHA